MDAQPTGRWHTPWLRRSCAAVLATLIALLAWQAYGSWLFSVDAHVG